MMVDYVAVFVQNDVCSSKFDIVKITNFVAQFSSKFKIKQIRFVGNSQSESIHDGRVRKSFWSRIHEKPYVGRAPVADLRFEFGNRMNFTGRCRVGRPPQIGHSENRNHHDDSTNQ